MLKQKNLIFIGAPGAGKGTISGVLLEKYPLVHISTGDILRDEIKRDTELGRQAAGLMKDGKLVPDEVVAGMVRARLAQKDCDNGFILDGFPRTVNQADLLAAALKDLGRPLDRVVYLKVDDELLLQRLTARQGCRKCGAIYNKLFMPSKKPGVCDACGGELFQRPDDSLETAKNRLAVFYKQTSPLIEYYDRQGKLLTLTATDKDELVALIEKELA
ncbi:MAG: adenylate kinase [Victivallaceae bacterium]|nr:adenylate kinase [Victivallaceae bacterium]